MIKIQIKSVFGKVLFEYEKENNTIKDTVLEAIKQNIDLSYSNLRYSNLSGSDLSGLNLSGSNLSGTNLKGSDLSGTNLSGTNLKGSDLCGTNLRDSNLRGADLSCANISKRYIQVSCIGSSKRMTTYCFDDDKIWCGCFIGTLQEFEEKVNETHKDNKQYLSEYIGFINYIKSLKQ